MTGVEKVQDVRIFDDISAQIYTDPLFLNAINNWNTDPRCLYNFCRALSFDRVRAELKDISRMSGIRNKGGYLYRRLKNYIERRENGELTA
jgi:hypothetical protein